MTTVTSCIFQFQRKRQLRQLLLLLHRILLFSCIAIMAFTILNERVDARRVAYYCVIFGISKDAQLNLRLKIIMRVCASTHTLLTKT